MQAERVARVSGLSRDEVLGVLVHATGSAEGWRGSYASGDDDMQMDTNEERAQQNS